MCQTFTTLNSNVAILPWYGQEWHLHLLFFYSTFLSPLTSLIDFFSLLTICLSLPTGVLSSSNQISSSSLNLKRRSLSMHLKSNPKMELVVSLADLDLMQMETPIPSSKQNLEMESSQTKKIFILSS